MTLDQILKSFAQLTQDPIGIGYRCPGESEARLVWVNSAFEAQFGYAARDIDSIPVADLIASGDYRVFLAKVQAHIAAGETHFTHEAMCWRKDGTQFWSSIGLILMPPDDDGGRYSVATYRDLGALKERERQAEISSSEKRLLLEQAEAARTCLLVAIDTFPGPMAIWDKDMRLVICNSTFGPRLMAQAGRPPPGLPIEDFLRTAAFSGQLCHAIGREEAWIAKALQAFGSGPIDDITPYTDGRTFRAVSFIAPNGDTVVFNSDITEITEQKQALEAQNVELELARVEADLRALHDELTCLGNRRFVVEGLAELLREREEKGGEIAVLVIDLDRFKEINDAHGHAAGDHVLAGVAARLRESVRPGDLLARVGGDEFIVLCLVTDNAMSPLPLGQRIVEVMRRPFLYEDVELRLGASVGIAMTPMSSVEDLVANADIALYKAKSLGRGTVVSFDKRDLQASRKARTLADDLLEAVEARTFLPYFQPQVDIRTQRIVGLEVLVRWPHPRRGILSPSAFLAGAADLKILPEIDAIVFEKAIEACRNAFQDRDGPNLSFNMGKDGLLSAGLKGAMTVAASYPGDVTVELPEAILETDRDKAIQSRVDLLRSVGVRIEIDSFGSDRGSILALEQFAPDRLKVDCGLVRSVSDSDRSRRLVGAIADAARALGIGVTGEGVETEEQAALLASLGCDRLQGRLYGQPMPVEDLVSVLDRMPAGRAAC